MKKIGILIGGAALVAFGLFIFLADDGASPAGLDVQEFDAFTLKFQKQYVSMADRALRFRTFQKNLDLIKTHNAKPSSYTLGVNQFADLTFKEFAAKYLSHVDPGAGTGGVCEEAEPPTFSHRPAWVNWHKAGKVQKVKDQGRCSSCWAFSAVGAVESALAIKNEGEIPDLSEQELIDCSRAYENEGCSGGFMHWAFNYIFDNKINFSKDYEYTARNGNCQVPEIGRGKTEIAGCVRAEPSVDGLKNALTNGPVSTAIYVRGDFHFYSSGVYNPQNCEGEVNHGVLAYGYCETDGVFFIKNSWGTSWGEQGHMKIAQGTGTGTCNLAGNGYNYRPTV